MAYIHTHHAPAFSASVIAKLNAISILFFATVSKWNNARLTRNTLLQLSERDLTDIGLNRYKIEQLFR